MNLPRSLAKNETAFVVIDMQNDYCKEGGFFSKVLQNDVKPILEMVPRLQRALERARKLGLTRIFVNTIHAPYTASSIYRSRMRVAPDFCLPGTWGAEFIDELKPKGGELVITKHRYSAFVDCDFPLVTRSIGAKQLIFAGSATNVCVESTVRDALMNDYLPIVLSDCVAASDRSEHDASLAGISKYFGVVAPSDQVFSTLV